MASWGDFLLVMCTRVLPYGPYCQEVCCQTQSGYSLIDDARWSHLEFRREILMHDSTSVRVKQCLVSPHQTLCIQSLEPIHLCVVQQILHVSSGAQI